LLGLSLTNYTIRAWRWHLYGRHLDIEVPAGRTGLYFIAGFAMTTTPGKLGEALRLWFLERCHGYRYDRTAPLLIGDRMGDAISTTFLCLAGLSLFGATYAGGTLVAAAALASGLLMLLRPRIPLRACFWSTRWSDASHACSAPPGARCGGPLFCSTPRCSQ
jgi:hypothetical protein